MADTVNMLHTPPKKKPIRDTSPKLDERIERFFGGEEKGIVKALFLSDKHDLSRSDSANLRFSGLSRFISIAGFHVTWAALAVELIVKKLTKNTNPVSYTHLDVYKRQM